MSKRAPAVSVLTANRLRDGIVVFLGGDGAWVESVEAASVARSPDEAQALEAQGARDSARNLVVEPYLAEVREAGGRLVPVRVRERVRVDGPSILDDVPGYKAPSPHAPSPSPRATPTSSSPSPRAARTSPRTPSARGEGRGEGQQHTASSALDPAPHPGPLPASGERELVASAEREPHTEVA